MLKSYANLLLQKFAQIKVINGVNVYFLT